MASDKNYALSCKILLNFKLNSRETKFKLVYTALAKSNTPWSVISLPQNFVEKSVIDLFLFKALPIVAMPLFKILLSIKIISKL